LPICTNGPPTVIGHLQQVVPDTAVDFTSGEGLSVIDPGFNAVSGQDPITGFDDMAITVPGHTFTSIILQLTSLSSVTDGTVTFTALTTVGGPFGSGPLTLSHTGGGQNYFTITADPGTLITELDFTVGGPFLDNVSQVRIGGVSDVTIVPEPATYGMVGFALIGLGWLRRRRPR
jgi:PEP-CTERM motif